MSELNGLCNAYAVTCCYDDITTMLLGCYRAVTVPLPCRYRAVTVPLPCRYRAVTVPLPCRYRAVTVPLPWQHLAAGACCRRCPLPLPRRHDPEAEVAPAERQQHGQLDPTGERGGQEEEGEETMRRGD